MAQRRSSGRQRFRPLAFWNNERVVYATHAGDAAPSIVDVMCNDADVRSKVRRLNFEDLAHSQQATQHAGSEASHERRTQPHKKPKRSEQPAAAVHTVPEDKCGVLEGVSHSVSEGEAATDPPAPSASSLAPPAPVAPPVAAPPAPPIPPPPAALAARKPPPPPRPLPPAALPRPAPSHLHTQQQPRHPRPSSSGELQLRQQKVWFKATYVSTNHNPAFVHDFTGKKKRGASLQRLAAAGHAAAAATGAR